jgi:hypothetical protein
MTYTLLTRYGANDQWTRLDFDTIESFEDEAVYKVKTGWQVKASDSTIEHFEG